MIEIRMNLKESDSGIIEELSNFLETVGVKREEIVEEKRKDLTRLLIYTRSSVMAQKVCARTKKAMFDGVNISVNRLKDEDWKTAWKKFYRPFRIAGNVYVVPAWEKKFSKGPKAKIVYIDTAMAFGTGLHPTTQMVSKFIEELSGDIKSVVDVGTGSGILSVVAAKCGAKKITAFDNDEEAVRTAEKNLILNKCENFRVFKKDVGNFKGKTRFDLVVANLVTDVLVENKKALARLVSPGGHLAVSGIYEDNYPFFKKHFTYKNLRAIRTIKKKKWYAVLFQYSLKERKYRVK